ncbi:MAG TPA: polysaccharide biosynthesis tyrosine autokinase [Gemmatimonadales bacterium]|nr:polysaccharide biosynthesis tyrosine autokinase [Gemmatimonadales bacterium]
MMREMTEQRPTERGDLEASVRTVGVDDLLAMLRRHVRLVIGVVAITVVAAGVLAYVIEPVYRAVALIRLWDPRRALTGGVVDDPARTDERFADPLLSQVELLTSRTVAGAVVDSMPMLRVLTRKFPRSALGDVAVLDAATADTIRLTFGADSVIAEGRSGRRNAAYGAAVDFGRIRFAVMQRPSAAQGQLRVYSREAAITHLLAHLRVKPRLRTDLVDVAYSASDAHLAQQVVNRVVDIYRTTSAEAAQQQSTRRREFLESQLSVNDSLLAEARDALTEFRQRARAFGSREAMARDPTGLAGLEMQRQQLEAERRTDADLLTSLSSPDSGVSGKALQTAFAVPGVSASPEVTQLNNQLFAYETTRDSLASRSKVHPDLPRLNKLIASTETKLLRAVQAAVQSAIVSLDGRLAAMNEMRAHQQQLSASEGEEDRLTERVDNARKVVDALRIESQQAKIAEAVTVGYVEIVDHASVPTKPAGLGLVQQLALGLLVGLMLGAGSAFLADRLSSAIARRDQVEQLGLSLLGVVTHLHRDAKGNGAKNPDALIEAFRGIRLSIMNESGASGPIVVAVTSPGSGDGKSFVSSNLALAFAYAKHRTLLVDADLRRGALHRVLSLPRQPGLTDVLVGAASREQAVQTSSHPRLDFIASGSRRRDAPELLASAPMADLVTSLRPLYDVIVVDTAPLAAGIDALTLAALAGNLLMVLRLGRTDRAMAEAKLEIVRRLPVRLLGAVLNDVRDTSEYSAYAYYMDGYELSNEPLFRPLAATRKAATPQATTNIERH